MHGGKIETVVDAAKVKKAGGWLKRILSA